MLLVFQRRIEYNLVQQFLQRAKLAGHRNGAGNIAMQASDANAKVQEYQFPRLQRFIFLHVMQAASVCTARHNRRERQIAIAFTLHFIIQLQAQIAFVLESLHFGKYLAEGVIRDRLRRLGIHNAFRFQRESQRPVQGRGTLELDASRLERLEQLVPEPVVVVFLELFKIVSVCVAPLRKLFRAGDHRIHEFVYGANILDSRNTGHFVITFQKAETLAIPEFLERVLGRHKKDFFFCFGVEQQVAACLVDSRQEHECRFLHHFIPDLHVGFFGSGVHGNSCKNTERIELLEHGLAAFSVQILGIVAVRRYKNLRIGLRN